MATQTTQRKQITGQPAPDYVTIYAPDGSSHKCAPVDAREILAAGLGYTAEPPAAVVEPESDEQQPEQQPVTDDATVEAAQSHEATPIVEVKTGEAIIGEALSAVQEVGKRRGKAR
jgi:hypothetical protein